MDLGALVQQVGFPIAIAIYFIWRDYQKSRDHMADIRGIAQQAVAALDKNTSALTDNNSVIDKNTTALDRNSVVLQRLEGGRNAANNSPTSN